MSLVKVQGNASGTGTLTIAAPNTNSNYTLTLPTETGTILTTATTATSIPGYGNLTGADQWRVSANTNITQSATDITANWERSDNTGAGYLGTGMTQSSGIFTFPSTGTWHIRIYGNASIDASNRYNAVEIRTTTNNSTYSLVAVGYAFVSRTNTNFTLNYCSAEYIFNVTDTSNCKVKFSQYGEAATGVWNGDTTANTTGATFIRLGAST